MNQLPASACLLGGLLGMLLLVPVLVAPPPTPPGLCTALKTLNSSLSHRRRYMKHNFPINYTIKVHYEEVFKLSNISRLRSQVEELEEIDLQRLWFLVNQGVLKKILRVLPGRHPSRSHTAELESRFRDVEGIFEQSQLSEVSQRELPERVQDIWDRMTEEPDRIPESSWRLRSPKSLLDSFIRTMLCLFNDCFPGMDYCGISKWRKGRKKDPQRAEEGNVAPIDAVLGSV